MNWKFKKDDIIIWPADKHFPLFIALVVDIDHRSAGPRYYLEFFDGLAFWIFKSFAEQRYRVLDWDIRFFHLFRIP